jgi:5,10-methenyltetrahydromethanopterin hydrogenase
MQISYQLTKRDIKILMRAKAVFLQLLQPDVYDVAQAIMATSAAGSLQLRDLVETVPTLSTDFTGFVATQENGTQASH